MTSSASFYLRYPTDATIGVTVFSAFLGFSCADSLLFGGVIGATGLVSSAASYKAVEIALNRDWSNLKTVFAIYAVSFSCYAITAAAFLALGITTGAWLALGLGAVLSALNVCCFLDAKNIAVRKEKSFRDWNSAKDKLELYEKKYEEYRKLVPISHIESPQTIFESYGKYDGSFFLETVDTKYITLHTVFEQAKVVARFERIDEKHKQYTKYFDQLEKTVPDVSGIQTPDEVNEDAHEEGWYSEANEAILDAAIQKIQARLTELGVKA